MENFNRTLWVCWFGVFTTSMGLSQIAPILPLYIKELCRWKNKMSQKKNKMSYFCDKLSFL